MTMSGKPLRPDSSSSDSRRVAGHTLLCNQELRFVNWSPHSHQSKKPTEKISIFVQTHGQRMSQSILRLVILVEEVSHLSIVVQC